MKDFLAEFWLWILIPGLVVAVGLIWLVMASGAPGSSPFIYNVF